MKRFALILTAAVMTFFSFASEVEMEVVEIIGSKDEKKDDKEIINFKRRFTKDNGH